jgi:hypothetical protein
MLRPAAIPSGFERTRHANLARLPLFAALLLGACAHPWNAMQVPPGSTQDQVIAQAGPPLRVVPLPQGGQRMQYTMQPMGQYAFMVDLDASGRVVNSRQVLTEANFNRIELAAGPSPTWTASSARRRASTPLPASTGRVLTYRMEGHGGRRHVLLGVRGPAGRGSACPSGHGIPERPDAQALNAGCICRHARIRPGRPRTPVCRGFRHSAGAHPTRPARRPRHEAAALAGQAVRAGAGHPVAQPRSLRLDGKYPEDAAARARALAARKPDVLVVAAYGLILPQWVLDCRAWAA